MAHLEADPVTRAPKKRRGLLAGVALAATLAGVGVGVANGGKVPFVGKSHKAPTPIEVLKAEAEKTNTEIAKRCGEVAVDHVVSEVNSKGLKGEKVTLDVFAAQRQEQVKKEQEACYKANAADVAVGVHLQVPVISIDPNAHAVAK